MNSTAPTQSFSLAANAPGCTSNGTSRTCLVPVNLPLGSDLVTLSTYDGPLTANGQTSGHLLATASTTQTIVEAQSNNVVISLMAVVSSVTITPQQSSIVSTGTRVTVPLSVAAFDAAGNPITGTTPYAQPIALTAQAVNAYFGNGPSVSVNGATNNALASPLDTASLVYAGRDGSGDYTIVATTNYGNQRVGTTSFAIQPGFVTARQLFTSGLANADLVQRWDTKDLWFTEPGTNKIGTLSANGVFSEFSVVSGKQPRHIIYTGLNGTGIGLGTPFFVTEIPDTIGILQTNGSIAERVVPTANSGLAGITFDGVALVLWFAESAVGKIGSMTLSGVMNEYPTGIPGSTPQSLSMNNQSGGVLFTDPGTNSIGWMKPDHSVVEYPIPTPNAGPSIMLGSCFTEANAPNLGCLNPTTGAITEYPAGDVIVALAPGASDGFTNLWVLLRNGTIEHVDSAFRFTPVPSTLPSGGQPVAIATGVNSDLWLLRNAPSVSDLDELIY